MDQGADSQPVAGTLILRRETSWSARIRTFQVLIDGHAHGVIRDGETTRISLPFGAHRLRLKVDWCRSPEVEFEVGEGEPPSFACRASYLSPLDPLIRPRRYIELVPATASLRPQRTTKEDFALRFLLTIIPVVMVISVLVALGAGSFVAVVFSVLWFLVVMSLPLRKTATEKRDSVVP